IRELEMLVGRPLFERLHRQIALTEPGRHLLDQLTPSFDAIDRRLGEIVERPVQEAVTVSVEPSLAAAWLVPHLDRFNARRPEIDVVIDASPMLVDFRSRSVDLAIRHSMTDTSWPRTQSRQLFHSTRTALMAPSMLAEGPPITTPADIHHYPLLHEDNRDGWSDWFRAAGVDDVEPQRGSIFPDAALAAQSAVLGHGVALGCRLLTWPDFSANRLVAPVDFEIPGGTYWLVAPDLERLSVPAKAFAEWLTEEIEKDIGSMTASMPPTGEERANPPQARKRIRSSAASR
ncbi:MAG: LysR substrate-binding domain-containing protein, partial [Pseudomonadota bacterium]|nr:LysR substrate-binding domain-containing protein [Pseudomonadota bacterium]